MDAIQLDPRDIAKALHMDTFALAELLTRWASDAVPAIEFSRAYAPLDLDLFDEQVANARVYLVEAHAAMDAYNLDNPEDETA